MRLYFGTPGWGWMMWGIGYKHTWFIGFSMRRVDDEIGRAKVVPNVKLTGCANSEGVTKK